MPPAFVLSQDQTLQLNLYNSLLRSTPLLPRFPSARVDISVIERFLAHYLAWSFRFWLRPLRPSAQSCASGYTPSRLASLALPETKIPAPTSLVFSLLFKKQKSFASLLAFASLFFDRLRSCDLATRICMFVFVSTVQFSKIVPLPDEAAFIY